MKYQTLAFTILIIMVLSIILLSIVYIYIKTAEIRGMQGKLYEILQPIETIDIFEAKCLENNRMILGIYNAMSKTIYNITVKIYYENLTLYDEIYIKRILPYNIFRIETYHPSGPFYVRIYYKGRFLREIYFTC